MIFVVDKILNADLRDYHSSERVYVTRLKFLLKKKPQSCSINCLKHKAIEEGCQIKHPNDVINNTKAETLAESHKQEEQINERELQKQQQK